jgi:ABC-2 type transport system ATP-binding protein
MEQPSVLEVADLVVDLGGVRILDGLDIDVLPGEFAWLSGPNGAGKSTFLRAIAGLIPWRGTIRIGGDEPFDTAARARFVYAPDQPVLYEDLTLAEHAFFMSRIYHQPEAEEQILGLLAGFLLEDRLEAMPPTLSRGMQQKLALALALGLRVDLYLLDEPYDGLDARARPVLGEAMAQRVEEGRSVLVTTHVGAQIDELRAHHEVRRIEMEDGRLMPGEGDRV